MAENSAALTTLMMPFDEWVEGNRNAINLLIERFKAKGVEMDEQTAWQYIAWCNSSVSQVIEQLGGPSGKYAVNLARDAVAPAAAASFIQKRTGKLSPPYGPRFDSPFDLEKMRRSETPTVTSDSYHPGGYL